MFGAVEMAHRLRADCSLQVSITPSPVDQCHLLASGSGRHKTYPNPFMYTKDEF